jgi:hypothetical protein
MELHIHSPNPRRLTQLFWLRPLVPGRLVGRQTRAGLSRMSCAYEDSSMQEITTLDPRDKSLSADGRTMRLHMGRIDRLRGERPAPACQILEQFAFKPAIHGSS